MTDIIFQLGAQTIRGINALEDFSYTIEETPLIVNPTTSNVQLNDANVIRSTSTSITPNFKIDVNPSFLKSGFNFVSKTPLIATVNSSGAVTGVGNGTATINIETPVGTKQITRLMTPANTFSDAFSSWVTNTLAHHIETAIANMISGKVPSATTSDWYDPNAPANDSQRPNPNRFTGSLDLFSMSVGYTQNMILISPWHVIGNHTSGTGTIIFRSSNGTYYTRDVTTLAPLASNAANGGGAPQDFVGLLSAEIPPTGPNAITPIKFLPSTYINKINKAQTTTYPLQILRKKQAGGNKVEILSASFFPFVANGLPASKSERVPFNAWSSLLADGDSNGAMFVPIDPAGGTAYQAVLVGTVNTPSGGQNYAKALADIQTKMNDLKIGETLQTISLASFPNV
jgi:hypothetical protein